LKINDVNKDLILAQHKPQVQSKDNKKKTKMILNSSPYLNTVSYIDQSKQATKLEFSNNATYTSYVEERLAHETSLLVDDDSDDESDLNHVYLSVDLSSEIVNKIKNLSTNELEQMKQIGILSVQVDDDNFKLNIPSERPHRSSLDAAKRDFEQQRSLLNSSSNYAAGQLQNEAAKKRSRKTISELTSPNVYENKDPYLAAAGHETTIDVKKLSRNKRNSKEMEPLIIQHSPVSVNSSMSQQHSSSSSSYVLTSMIVDQSPNSHLMYPASAQLNSQFNYLKQFTMPSPMLSNILNSSEASAGGGILIQNDKLMNMDEYKNIYQMRQELASQVGAGKDEDKGSVVQAKKTRRAPSNPDPNKPKVKRNRQPKPDTIQALGSAAAANKSADSSNSSQPQLIRNMISHNSSFISNTPATPNIGDTLTNAASNNLAVS
jgi:hypothetical protein